MRKKLICLLAAAATAVGLATGIVPSQPAHADVTGTGGDFVRLTNVGELADTRSGYGVTKAAIGAGGSLAVPVLGHGGVPSTGVSAVMVTLSAYAPTATTYLAAYQGGTTFAKDTSTMNISTGTSALSNSAVVQVGSNGAINVYNNAGSVNVQVLVQGYYTTATGSTGPGGFTPVYYRGILDTRTGVGAPKAQIAAGAALSVTVTGGSVPSDADSVYLNLIVTNATQNGWLAEYPYGGTATTLGVLGFPAGGSTSTALAVKPTSGKVTFVNHSTAAIDLVATQVGYTSSTSTTGSGFHPSRQRLLSATSVAANATVTVQVVGRPGLPTQHITGAVLDIAASDSGTGGYLRAWGTGNTEPSASAVNLASSSTRAELAVVGLASAGSVSIHNVSSNAITLYVDLEGWFSDEHRSASPVQFAPTVALQLPAAGTAPGAIEYSYVDNVGRLLTGYQASPDDFSTISWTTVSSLGDVLTGMPSLTGRSDGSTMVSAEYTDTGVRTKTQAAGATTWSASFTNTGGSFSAPPAVGALPAGNLYSFAVDDAGALWIRADSATSSWVARSTSPALVGTPTVVTTGNGIQVFAVTTAGTVVTANYQGGASLSAWTDLGGSGVTDRPAVAVRPGYLFQVVIRQGDGSIATKAQAGDGSFPAAWAPVDSISALGAPATVFDPVTGQIEILARGQDGYIYNSGETVQGSQTWRSWQVVSSDASATDPTIATFTGSANGDGWIAPYRNSSNASRVIVRTYPNGAAFAAAHPSYATEQLASPPAG